MSDYGQSAWDLIASVSGHINLCYLLTLLKSVKVLILNCSCCHLGRRGVPALAESATKFLLVSREFSMAAASLAMNCSTSLLPLQAIKATWSKDSEHSTMMLFVNCRRQSIALVVKLVFWPNTGDPYSFLCID